jgi:hypothetical protein
MVAARDACTQSCLPAGLPLSLQAERGPALCPLGPRVFGVGEERIAGSSYLRTGRVFY